MATDILDTDMMDNDKWKDCVSPRLVALVEKIEEEGNPTAFEREYIQKLKVGSHKKKSDTVPNFHLIAATLFELSFVSITRSDMVKLLKDAPLNPCVAVYGDILLTDENGNKFYIFSRDRKDAEVVYLTVDVESIMIQKFDLGSIRCLPKRFCVQFSIKDGIRDIVLVQGCEFIDFSFGITYDKEQYITYEALTPLGPFCCCSPKMSVGYTVFQCAVLAIVGLKVFKIHKHDRTRCAKVSGSISATTRLRVKGTCIKRLVFDKPNIPQKFKFGVPTEVCELAVPVYSSLELQAGLEVNGEIWCGDDSLVFEAGDINRGAYDEKEIATKSYRILVSVMWKHPNDHLPENLVHEWGDAASREELEAPSDYTTQLKPFPLKRMKSESLYFIPQQLLDVCHRRRFKYHLGEVLVEVFSITVYSYDDEDRPLRLYGTIQPYDRLENFSNIFDRDKKELEILHPHETLPLVESSRCYKGTCFGMHLDLKDAEEREISNGFVSWDYHNIVDWHDRRILSVVPGKHGFAVVHHLIFSDAIQAKVKVILKPNNLSVCLVDGSIRARYSTYRYSSHYEKKYFESVLFETRKSDQNMVLMFGEEVPLTKSIVGVPCNASLILNTNFRVLVDGKNVETLRGEATLKPKDLSSISFNATGKPEECEVQASGLTCHFDVLVEWG